MYQATFVGNLLARPKHWDRLPCLVLVTRIIFILVTNCDWRVRPKVGGQAVSRCVNNLWRSTDSSSPWQKEHAQVRAAFCASNISHVYPQITETSYRQPPLKDLVGLCWSASSKPKPVSIIQRRRSKNAPYSLPARSAAARAGPLSASISDNLVWTSANLIESSSLASSNRLSSPSFSSSANFASRDTCSFMRWSRQTSAFNTESIAVVSSPTIYIVINFIEPTVLNGTHFLFHK